MSMRPGACGSQRLRRHGYGYAMRMRPGASRGHIRLGYCDVMCMTAVVRRRTRPRTLRVEIENSTAATRGITVLFVAFP